MKRNLPKKVIRIIKIQDWMSKPVITVEENDPVEKVIKLMDEHNIGSVPVVYNNKPVGIITERDIIRRVVSKGEDIKSIKVKKVMTKKPVTVEHDSSLLEVTRLMSKNNFRRLIVVNNDELIGIVTAKDVIELLSA